MTKKFIVVLILLFSIYLISCKTSQYKLLVYATVEDSLEIHKSNEDWLKNEICFKINIDTIDLKNVKFLKRNHFKNNFKYDNHIYYTDQLFDMTEYEKIANSRIYSFNVASIFIEPRLSDLNSSCLNNIQINLIKKSWTHYRNQNRKGKIYFEEIEAILNNNDTIKMNSLTCELK